MNRKLAPVLENFEKSMDIALPKCGEPSWSNRSNTTIAACTPRTFDQETLFGWMPEISEQDDLHGNSITREWDHSRSSRKSRPMPTGWLYLAAWAYTTFNQSAC